MDAGDVFEKVSNRQLQALMLHESFADYFDFLGLMGFKRWHEYQYLQESVERRCIHRYYVNHYNKLLPKARSEVKSYIPDAWRGYKRGDVEPDARERAVRDIMREWVEWETESKECYQDCVSQLMEMHETAAADVVAELVEGVDNELKRATRAWLELEACGYDAATMILMQPDMHAKYKRKVKKLGCSIC